MSSLSCCGPVGLMALHLPFHLWLRRKDARRSRRGGQGIQGRSSAGCSPAADQGPQRAHGDLEARTNPGQIAQSHGHHKTSGRAGRRPLTRSGSGRHLGPRPQPPSDCSREAAPPYTCVLPSRPPWTLTGSLGWGPESKRGGLGTSLTLAAREQPLLPTGRGCYSCYKWESCPRAPIGEAPARPVHLKDHSSPPQFVNQGSRLAACHGEVAVPRST